MWNDDNGWDWLNQSQDFDDTYIHDSFDWEESINNESEEKHMENTIELSILLQDLRRDSNVKHSSGIYAIDDFIVEIIRDGCNSKNHPRYILRIYLGEVNLTRVIFYEGYLKSYANRLTSGDAVHINSYNIGETIVEIFNRIKKGKIDREGRYNW